MSPENVTKLVKLGFNVQVEENAGSNANFTDADYTSSGATVLPKSSV